MEVETVACLKVSTARLRPVLLAIITMMNVPVGTGLAKQKEITVT